MEINNNRINSIKQKGISSKQELNQTNNGYEEKDYFNSKNPSEYIGRSQVVFRGRNKAIETTKEALPKMSKEDLKPIELTENPVVSKEECIDTLKKLYFTDEEIAQIDFNDEKNIRNVSSLKAYYESDIIKDNRVEFENNVREVSSEERIGFINNEIPSSLKYFNDKNFNTLSKYVDLNVDNMIDFLERICDEDSKSMYLEKIPLIFYAQGKCEPNEFYNLERNDNSKYCTYERADILRRINNTLINKNLPIAQCSGLGKDEDLTTENIEKYLKLLEKYAKNDAFEPESFTTAYDYKTLKELTDSMEKIDDVLSKYPMDFDGTSKFSRETLEKITQRKDIEDTQKYINSLSKDAKYRGCMELPEEGSKLDKSKLAELCNLVLDKDYGKIRQDSFFEYIKKQAENDYKNLDGIIELVKVYKGTDELDTSYIDRVLNVVNDDYKGAADVIKIKQDIKNKSNLRFNEYAFHDAFYDSDINYSELAKCLTYMRDNNIDGYDVSNIILKDKNGYNKLVLKHQIGKPWEYNHEQMTKMYSLGDMIKTQDELDYAIELYNQRRYSKDEYSNRFQYNFDDIKEVIEAYQNDKELTKTVADMKDNNGEWRLQTKDDILNTIEAFKIDKKSTEDILDLKYKNNYRFSSGKTIKSMVEAAQIDKDYLLEILHVKHDPEYNARTEYRFNNADNIKNIIEAGKIDKEYTNYLIDLKAYDEYGQRRYRINDTNDYKFFVEKAQEDKEFTTNLLTETQKASDNKDYYRFSTEQIKAILDNPPENKEFLKDIIYSKENRYGYEHYKYQTYEISQLAQAAGINLALTKELLNATITHHENTYARFNDKQEILSIVKNSVIDPEFTQELLKYKAPTYYKDDISPRFNGNEIGNLVSLTKDFKKEDIKRLIDMNYPDYCDSTQMRPRFQEYEITMLLKDSEDNKEFVDEMLEKKYRDSERPRYTANDIHKFIEAKKIDDEFATYLIKTNDSDENPVLSGDAITTLTETAQKDKELTKKLLEYRTIDNSGSKHYRFDYYDIERLVECGSDKKEFLIELLDETHIDKNGKKQYRYDYHDIQSLLSLQDVNKEFLDKLSKLTTTDKKGKEIPLYNGSELYTILKNLSIDDYNSLEAKIGDTIKKCGAQDLITAVQFKELYNISSINELPLVKKKSLLSEFISTNANLFNLSEDLKQYFPLIPINIEQYCSILPALVRSIGIETNELNDKEIEEFNTGLNSLSNTLANISNDDFNNLEITQEFSKDEFTKTILKKLDKADIPATEKQKVFDYFGFELRENPNNKVTGYSIIGYPVNLNNGKKLAEIKDEKTKQIVEDIRKDVIKFSENNKINSNNKELQQILNDTIKFLPEARTMIGKTQHGMHDFDIIKHSLKVMQNVSRDPEFKTLNDSDKKVLLLATLLHDITKAEGLADATHPHESAFDASYITKKFKLNQDEQIKLYTLINKHEWLGFINSNKITEAEREKRIQSVSFDLQQGNLFKLARIFTEADITAIKKDENNPKIVEWRDSINKHIDAINQNISELKKSQPLLPSTKMPKASTVEKAITHVEEDGSTNIKGVYKTKEGLVVIKFNEVEDWEAIGLPKGSTNKGIKAKAIDNQYGERIESETETGNIKFFVHGLDYPNQLARFDAFAIPNSDALLSVSYAERPETKYRFFRPQGVMLDVSADYVYGGGNTDSGSGCGKNIDNFKTNYVFGGYRESDRKYISELIKEETGMSDEEYVQFVEKNKNKPMTEIEPKELQIKIIQKLATINSNHRKGNRAYNEMYISNPKEVMGVFAYEMNDSAKIEDPLKFLEDNNGRTDFLKKYAIEHDIPFYVFGD